MIILFWWVVLEGEWGFGEWGGDKSEDDGVFRYEVVCGSSEEEI